MIQIFFSMLLLTANGADGQRSLADPGRSLGGGTEEATGTPVKGSKMLYIVKPVVDGSETAFLVKHILDLENVMAGVNLENDKEVRKKDPQLRKAVSSVLDLDALGRAALITYWDQVAKMPSGKQKLDHYMSLFRDLVEENYMEKIRTYIGGKYRITFTDEVPGKKGTIARAKIKKKDADVIVEFLGQKKDDGWHIVDTRLDETSLEETYRGSFNRIIKKHGGVQKGFAELIKVMEKRLKELKSGKATKL